MFKTGFVLQWEKFPHLYPSGCHPNGNRLPERVSRAELMLVSHIGHMGGGHRPRESPQRSVSLAFSIKRSVQQNNCLFVLWSNPPQKSSLTVLRVACMHIACHVLSFYHLLELPGLSSTSMSQDISKAKIKWLISFRLHESPA